MKAMQLTGICQMTEQSTPLSLTELPIPRPAPEEVLLKVSMCAVCHTELDEIEGRTPPPRYPVVPGHQVIGSVVDAGCNAKRFQIGARLGVAWIFSACGNCGYCTTGLENLCTQFSATGRDANGGYAEYMTVHQDFAFSIPDSLRDEAAAPLLCAGAIGYRSLRLSGIRDGQTLGLTGFGASAHLVLKMLQVTHPSSEVYVFARNAEERRYALELGAGWAGNTDDTPPRKLAAIIDTTPVWHTLLRALEHLEANGRLVINAIRKEDTDKQVMAEIDYPRHLWLEKDIKSVANVTRKDVADFLQLADQLNLQAEVQLYPLTGANQALCELKFQRVRGAKVLQIGSA